MALIATGIAAAQTGDFPPITNDRLHDPEPGDWLSYRRSYDVTAFSPLTDINRQTVNELRLVWAYTMRDNSRWVATPIVANGPVH
jgi:alcohol dehydrogenase (cytochrome c)